MKKIALFLVAVFILPLATLFAGCGGVKLDGIVFDLTFAKVEYIVDQQLDLSELIVLAHYSDDSTAVVTDYVLDTSAVRQNEPGEYTVIVKYKKFKKNLTINYYEKGVITAESNNKFFVNQSFLSADPKLYYEYGGKDKFSIINWTLSSFDSSQVGEATAIINYLGEKYECKVEVLSNEDYLAYILKKLNEHKQDMTINSIKTQSGEDFSYISASSTAYVKQDTKEYWVDAGNLYLKEGESYTLSSFVNYEMALNSIFPDVDFPLSSEYIKIIDGLGDFEVASIELSNEGQNVTVKLTSEDQLSYVSFVIDMRSYTLTNYEFLENEVVTKTEFNLPFESNFPSDVEWQEQ